MMQVPNHYSMVQKPSPLPSVRRGADSCGINCASKSQLNYGLLSQRLHWLDYMHTEEKTIVIAITSSDRAGPDSNDWMIDAPLASRVPAVAVADIVAAAEPIVALGTAALTPFMASASADNVANPTEAGLYRKTE